MQKGKYLFTGQGPPQRTKQRRLGVLGAAGGGGLGGARGIIVKADVQGSLEAIVASLEKVGNDEVKINVIHNAIGAINESDVSLAGSAQGVVIGFNIRAIPQARTIAKRDKVDIRYYSIIYELIDDMKKMLSGLLGQNVSRRARPSRTTRCLASTGWLRASKPAFRSENAPLDTDTQLS